MRLSSVTGRPLLSALQQSEAAWLTHALKGKGKSLSLFVFFLAVVLLTPKA